MINKLRKYISNATTGLDAIQRAPIVDYETDLRCLRIQDISQSKSFSNWGFTSADKEEVSNFLIKNGDNFMARTGSTIGCSLYSNSNLESVFNNGLIRLRTNNQMLPKYLSYVMQTNSFQHYVYGVSMASATQPNIKINDLLDYELDVPFVEQQQHIVNIVR